MFKFLLLVVLILALASTAHVKREHNQPPLFGTGGPGRSNNGGPPSGFNPFPPNNIMSGGPGGPMNMPGPFSSNNMIPGGPGGPVGGRPGGQGPGGPVGGRPGGQGPGGFGGPGGKGGFHKRVRTDR